MKDSGIPAGMTLEEKISYCTGSDMWHTKEMEKYGIESMMMSDGPHGLRCQMDTGDNLGLNDSLPATCFPTAVTSANTWNEELIRQEGRAIAEEAAEAGVSMVLGPGCNIKRNPLAGRNFEYYSEDPLQSGRMGAAFIKGAEERGIYTCLKHFACNNQEYKRQNGDSIVDERALREIYLRSFEIAVKQGKPSAVMCSYNKINGTYSSGNRKLLTGVLRNEWGFDGAVVSDWSAMADRVEAFRAGMDLNMPGGSDFMDRDAAEAVRSGKLAEADIDRSVSRILKLVRGRLREEKGFTFDRQAHHALAKRIAAEGAVLLKNEGALPLSGNDICLLGNMASNIRYQGSGSSHINPTALKQMRDLLPDVPFAEAVDEMGNLKDLGPALALAKECGTAVVCAGLPESYESEAFDRDDMKMPEGYNTLIEEVSRVNGNVVVVLFGGSVMEIPWADKVNAILYMGLPGQAGAEAAVDLLFGREVPGGKLSESWPYAYGDVASRDTFGKRNTQYRESVYVGYRYYGKSGVKVRYPYGYGLSYTTFMYSDIRLDDGTVSCSITNTGGVKGRETVQLYVSPRDRAFRPVRELRDFAKVELSPGETKTVCFRMDDSWFSVYDGGLRKIGGEYDVIIASSSEACELSAEVSVGGESLRSGGLEGTFYENCEGTTTREDFEKLLGREIQEEVPQRKGSFTMDNSCLEMKNDSLIMKIMYLVTKSIISKPFRKEERTADNASYRMMLTAATDCPMRASVIASGGMMKQYTAEGLVEMANGHFFRGLLCMMRK